MTDSKPRAPALATRCRRCRKPIVWPGLCYTCATGLPRQILREYKRKRYFKSNGELQREKAKAAARRRTKRFRGPKPARPAR